MEEQIIKLTYQQQVYNILEKMIVSGKLQSGQRLVESELASSLGVSRSPVREAMIQLEQEGLVTNRRSEGWIVSKISLRDVIELYDLRKIIEVHAGKIGCLNCPKKIREEMEVTFEELDKSKEIEVWREMNRRFHELIVLSCKNKKIHGVFIWAMKNLRWCSHITMRVPGRQKQSMSEHRKILEAFLRKDQQLLGKAICEHIETVQNNIKSKGLNTRLLRR